MSIFKTDPRLRNLIHTNPTVHNAYHMALSSGDDVDALIMAVLVLVNTNKTLMDELLKYIEGAPLDSIVPPDSVSLDGLRVVDEVKG